jgi:hypothetical protein
MSGFCVNQDLWITSGLSVTQAQSQEASDKPPVADRGQRHENGENK